MEGLGTKCPFAYKPVSDLQAKWRAGEFVMHALHQRPGYLLVWAIMNYRELDPTIPQEFLKTARPFGFTEKSLWDPPATESEFSREAARKYAEKQVGIIKESIFPLHGIKG